MTERVRTTRELYVETDGSMLPAGTEGLHLGLGIVRLDNGQLVRSGLDWLKPVGPGPFDEGALYWLAHGEIVTLEDWRKDAVVVVDSRKRRRAVLPEEITICER